MLDASGVWSTIEIVSLRRKLHGLQRTRRALQVGFASRTLPRPADAAHLMHLRTLAETSAKQIDVLIAAMQARQVGVKEIQEAKDLRISFRLALDCIEGLVER